jgi:gliding motility-associated-like protein
MNNMLEAVPATGSATGIWDIPTGSFSYNPILPNTLVQNNSGFGNYEAIWTVSNSPFCTDSDTTHLIYALPEQAEIQGFDIQTCGYSESMTALNSNGMWSSPNPQISFSDPNSSTTTINTSSEGAFTIVWTVGSGDCATSDDRTILFEAPAVATINALITEVCSDGDLALDVTAMNGTGLLWESDGDGDFSLTNNLSTVYSPGSTDSINGNVTITITNYGDGICPDVTDEIDIDIIPMVAVNVPSFGNPICGSAAISINANATNASSVLWSTSGDGDFTPNTSVELVAYTPGEFDIANGSVTLTLTGTPQTTACSPVSSSTTIMLEEPANAGVDGNLTLCVSGAIVDLQDGLDPEAESGGVFIDANDSGALNGSTFDPSIAGVGSYNFNYLVSGTAPCGDDTSVLTVDVVAGPNPGNDSIASVCVLGPPTDLLNYLSPDAELGGVWAPHPALSGSLFNQNMAGLGSYTLYYVVPSNAFCEADSAAIQLSVTSGPSAGIDANISECTSSEAIDLFNQIVGSPDPGGIWNDLSGSGALSGGILDASQSGSGEFIFEYIIEWAGCNPDTSFLTVEIVDAPTADIFFSPTSICSSDTIFLEGAVSNTTSNSWESNGMGEFESNSALQNYYVPSQTDIDAGTVDLSLIGIGAPSCLQAVDVETVQIITSPIANAGLDGLTCGLDYVFPAIPSVGPGIWSGPPGIVYSSNPNAPFTVPSPGVYVFTWTENNQGCVDSDQVTIEFASSPVITSTSIDCINTNIEYNVVLQLEQGDPSSYQFSVAGNLLGSEFTSIPYATGSSYSIEVWDMNECDTFLVEGEFTCPVLTNPGTFDLTPLEYCEGDQIIAPYNDDAFLDANDAFVFILHENSPGIGTILASSNAPEFAFQPGMQLDVTYYVSSAAGNDIGGGLPDLNDPNTLFSEAVPLRFNSPPTVSVLTNEYSICEGDSLLIELSFTGSPSFTLYFDNAGIEGELSFSSGSGSFYVSEEGTILVDSIADAYCVSSANNSFAVTQFDIPDLAIADSLITCSNTIDPIEVVLEGVSPWSYTVLYEGAFFTTQNSSDSESSFLPESSGTYSIINLTDANCFNPSFSEIEVLINNSPLSNAGPDLIVCANEEALIGSQPELGASYSWSNQSTLDSPSSSITTLLLPQLTSEVITLNYTLTANLEGCIDLDSVSVTVNPIPQEYGIDGVNEICEGDSTIIEAYGGIDYSWSEEASLSSPLTASTAVTPIESISYVVEIFNEYGCSIFDSILVEVNENPIPLSSVLVIDPCPPAQVLWINESEGNLMECIWTLDGASMFIDNCDVVETQYPNSGLYSGSLSVTSIYGCTSVGLTDTIEVFSAEADFSFSPSIPTTDDPYLEVFDLSENAISQLWTLNEDSAGFGSMTTLSLEGLRPDYYEICLVMTTTDGCLDTTCSRIELDNPVAVFVPNTFTPNGDGLNDEFKAVINGSDYLQFYEMSVYDRKGHIQFRTSNPKEGWDGINKRDNTIALGLFEWVLEIGVFGEPYPRRYIGTITALK